MKLSRTLPLLLLVSALGVGVWYAAHMSAEEAPPTRAWGHVDVRETSLAFEASGRILELGPEEGARVASGEVLGRLDTEALELERDRALAELAALEARAALAEEGYRAEEVEAARKEAAALLEEWTRTKHAYDRQVGLDRAGSTSRQLLEDARYAESAAKSRYEAAKARLNAYEAGLRPEEVKEAQARAAAARAGIAILDRQISKASVLTAPRAGVVRSRLAEPGDMAAPTRTVYRIAHIDPKWVRAYVTERQLGFVAEGTPARVSSDTTEPLQGTVVFVSSTAEFTPKSVQTEALRPLLVYEVKVSVPDAGNVLRLGQPVTVDFEPQAR